MSLTLSTHSRFAWFQTGLFGGAGRGGPGRLVAIVAAFALAWWAGCFFLSVRHGNGPPVSQVTKMKPGNLLPGGLQGTPAQDALQKEDLQEKAKAAEAAHKSYTPPIPSSTASTAPARRSRWVGGAGVRRCPRLRRSSHRRREPHPSRRAAALFHRRRWREGPSGARVTKVAAGDGEEAPGAEEKARASSGRRRSETWSTAGAPGHRRRRW